MVSRYAPSPPWYSGAREQASFGAQIQQHLSLDSRIARVTIQTIHTYDILYHVQTDWVKNIKTWREQSVRDLLEDKPSISFFRSILTCQKPSKHLAIRVIEVLREHGKRQQVFVPGPVCLAVGGTHELVKNSV